MTHMLLTPADILSNDAWAQVRAAKREEILTLKAHRRVEAGPFACFYFENRATLTYQVQEMLRIEGAPKGQLEDELAAYNPLIPNGQELVATFMIEISDEARRRATLAKLGGIESRISLVVAGEAISAVAEDDQERTTAAGKTSAIHFLRFPLSAAQIAAFKLAETEVQIRIAHAEYGHIALLSPAAKAALAQDFA
jgi:Protein of unknown function (DUF3501)